MCAGLRYNKSFPIMSSSCSIRLYEKISYRMRLGNTAENVYRFTKIPIIN